ncbi:hypothetical protein AOQ84DRAFT_373035 [Glonium stellatum]|uniref:Uncharacterized protein n=1 Tax=Glonium stellatum TaxID=574774 RepID=A0A8E2JX84_9PEZI|nr:hypothetical protein AOQ84DRAFT_373035 [Glonium stellatum]
MGSGDGGRVAPSKSDPSRNLASRAEDYHQNKEKKGRLLSGTSSGTSSGTGSDSSANTQSNSNTTQGS